MIYFGDFDPVKVNIDDELMASLMSSTAIPELTQKECDLDEFICHLDQSGLVAAESMSAIATDSQIWKRRGGSQALAQNLVESGDLTHWQASKLLSGQFKGFYLDNYEVLQPLGNSESTAAYKARHMLLDRIRVIKILAHTYFAKCETFRCHVERRRGVICDGVVPVINMFASGNICVAVQEFVQGRTLSELVAVHGPLDLKTALQIAMALANTLTYSHKSNFVFNNLSPLNVILDPKGAVRITTIGQWLNEGDGSDVSSEHGLMHQPDMYGVGNVLRFLLVGAEVEKQRTPTSPLSKLVFSFVDELTCDISVDRVPSAEDALLRLIDLHRVVMRNDAGK